MPPEFCPLRPRSSNFVNDPSPDKRVRLIDTIMKRPEFVDYWAYKWSDLLLVTSNRLSDEEMWAYYNWIHDSVASNKPWDKFVYQIVTATGNTIENGAANYWLVHRDPLDTTENMAQAFLGHHYHLRALPQSSPGQVDAKRLLRHGQLVRASAAEDLRRHHDAPGHWRAFSMTSRFIPPPPASSPTTAL